MALPRAPREKGRSLSHRRSAPGAAAIGVFCQEAKEGGDRMGLVAHCMSLQDTAFFIQQQFGTVPEVSTVAHSTVQQQQSHRFPEQKAGATRPSFDPLAFFPAPTLRYFVAMSICACSDHGTSPSLRGKREGRLSNVFWLSGKRVFNPEDLRELGVAFENCCAAMPEARSQPQFREQLASRLLSWAALGPIESTRLYVRALNTYRALHSL
jgi:hypothetical protein